MSAVHIRHIKLALEKQFRGLIDMSDYKNQKANEEADAFLSRAQAAFSLQIVGGVGPDVAASSVVDAFDDNGIDAIHFDDEEKTLYLVQSKWHNSGQGSIELGDLHKFAQGVRDLLEANFASFNKKVKLQEQKILAALDDPAVRFRLVLVHTGAQPLSKHATKVVNALLDEVNDASNMISSQTVNQSELHKAVVSKAEGESIKLEILLSEWGCCKQPYLSYYGQVEAADVATWWKENQQNLFAKNLRKFTGSTDVNEGIKETLVSEPTKFWYFNNGITILCGTLRKKPMGGGKRNSGAFQCEAVSIVNGAQTVGCIGALADTNPDSLANAKVNVRLISLANCPEDFSTEITRASNTQNRIERKDFAALDPEQERLRRDLSLELNKNYFYKSGEIAGEQKDGCTIEEATIALACAIEDVSIAVQAKREVGKLWENVAKPPYKLLFSGALSALRMWRTVELMRIVESSINSERNSRKGRERMIVVHGNRLIAHLVFQTLDLSHIEDSNFEMTELNKAVLPITKKCVGVLVLQVERLFPSAYTNSLFKNATKCRELRDEVVKSVKSLSATKKKV